jgi:hypothetical protein
MTVMVERTELLREVSDFRAKLRDHRHFLVRIVREHGTDDLDVLAEVDERCRELAECESRMMELIDVLLDGMMGNLVG